MIVMSDRSAANSPARNEMQQARIARENAARPL